MAIGRVNRVRPLVLSKPSGSLCQTQPICGHSRRCIGEARAAIELTKERWCEAEVHRMAGEISLKWPHEDEGQPETHFQRALASARAQQTKSFELRAAMSLARLWRDQGKVQLARIVGSGLRVLY